MCEATPKEGIKLIHERFSNRTGKPGANVNRDRRMEFRIGALKKLIKNKGSNFGSAAIQLVNATVDIKEELFIHMRDSHGTGIRSGNHNARSDSKDFERICKHLTDTKAHLKISGRNFGDLKFHENLMENKTFDKVKYYRWLATKNKEMFRIMEAKKT